ncbi:LysR family substrate-binding domain-containing protein [Nocardioides sp.]|uniref:LysR family substrate-binding domain-containing protein n=1 Tax=Nocardioides sp. TaxID=35761 RepID=UPI003D0B22D1
MAFSVGFVPGVTPDKWARVWRRRETEELNLSLVDPDDQETALIEGRHDACFVRMPVDRGRLHCIGLYREVPVVVVPLDHPVTAYDEIALADLAGEQLVQGDVPQWSEVSAVEQLAFPDMSIKDAIEVVASGTGIVVVPMSVARLHHRKDVEHRPVLDLPETEIGLAWLRDNDDPRIQTFIGIVRGRTDNSSRGERPSGQAGSGTPAPHGGDAAPRPAPKRKAAQKAADKKARRRGAGRTR